MAENHDSLSLSKEKRALGKNSLQVRVRCSGISARGVVGDGFNHLDRGPPFFLFLPSRERERGESIRDLQPCFAYLYLTVQGPPKIDRS